MGQDPGNVSTVDELRGEIAQTRAELGETAAALGAKADVKGRARERVHEIKQNVSARTPSSAGEASAAVKRNPVPAAIIVAFAAGFAIGWLLAR